MAVALTLGVLFYTVLSAAETGVSVVNQRVSSARPRPEAGQRGDRSDA